MHSQGSNPPTEQHPDRPGANPLFTVTNAMFICGIDSPMLFQGDSQAERIAGEVFDDAFLSCVYKTVK